MKEIDETGVQCVSGSQSTANNSRMMIGVREALHHSVIYLATDRLCKNVVVLSVMSSAVLSLLSFYGSFFHLVPGTWYQVPGTLRSTSTWYVYQYQVPGTLDDLC